MKRQISARSPFAVWERMIRGFMPRAVFISSQKLVHIPLCAFAPLQFAQANGNILPQACQLDAVQLRLVTQGKQRRDHQLIGPGVFAGIHGLAQNSAGWLPGRAMAMDDMAGK